MAHESQRRRSRAFPSKLTAPTLPLVLERPRLYRRLDRARKRSVIWIAGPPGAGKTTLVAGYLRAKRVRPLWYNVDERDGDLATFFHYLGLATQRVAPRFRHPLPHLTPEYALGLTTFARNFFEALYSRLKPPAVLVFDNYQQIAPDSRFHDMLQIGLSEIPTGVTVVMLSRLSPPSAFASLEATQRLEVIEPEALRLTEQESDGIIRLHAMKERWTVPKPVREEMHRRVQGWVAGLILVLGQVKAGERGTAAAHDKSPEILFEYLASQSLDGLPAETHTFLLKTAQLSVMTAAMAERLTGLTTAGEMLTKLHRARYFTERRIEAQTWYQYHPLFREFLLARGHALFPAAELKALQCTAATLLAEAGRIEEAVQLWQETGDTAQSVALILSQGPQLVAQGRTQTLEAWLNGLPRSALETHPWLFYWQAVARLPVNPHDSRHIFEEAYERLKAKGDRLGALLAWCGVMDASFFAGGEAVDVEGKLAEVQNLLPEEGTFPTPEIELRVASSLLYLLHWQSPQHPWVAVWHRRVLPRLAEIPDLILTGRIALDLIQHAVWTADYALARAMLALLRDRMTSEAAPPLARLHFMLGDIMLSYPQGEPVRTLAKVKTALELAERSGIHILTPWIAGQLVLAQLLMFDLAGAQSWLDKLRPSMEHRADVIGGFYHYMTAKLCCYKGERQDALRHAEIAAAYCGKAGALYCEALSRLGLSKLLYVAGRGQEAGAHLAWALGVARDINGKLLESVGSFISAEVAFARGDEAGGIEALRKGLGIGAAGESTYPMWCDAASWSLLCGKALDAGIEPAYVKKLIRIMRLPPEGPVRHYEAWPWPIRIRMLGRFAVQVDDKPLHTTRKTPRRLLELLQTIVAFGGQNVPVSRVIDALWPEAEGDAAYRALISSLARLRKLLGHAEAIGFQDGRLSLNSTMAWVDAVAFETLAQESKPAVRAAVATSDRSIEQAFRLYRGAFLAEESDVPWAEPTREKFRAKYVRLVEGMVQFCQDRGEWEDAIARAEHAVQTEPLSEPLYRLLMTTLQQAGRPAAAQEAYVRCCKALHQSGYGLPSRETIQVYKVIQSM
jgi:ATP/maltotriose-dependent transcriptional regulator MalT/DNA-binding SARP family transcriptional activator